MATYPCWLANFILVDIGEDSEQWNRKPQPASSQFRARGHFWISFSLRMRLEHFGVPTLTKAHQTRPVGSLGSYSIGFWSVGAKYQVSTSWKPGFRPKSAGSARQPTTVFFRFFSGIFRVFQQNLRKIPEFSRKNQKQLVDFHWKTI